LTEIIAVVNDQELQEIGKLIRYFQRNTQQFAEWGNHDMKKLLSLLVIVLVIWMGVGSSAIAYDARIETMFYGDYAYTLENGQATIVWCSGCQCSPRWYDDADYWGEGIANRPGKMDEAATFPHFIDGVWRMVVPDSLNGYPVVAIGSSALSECDASDIILPEGLISIGAWAFMMCQGVHAITVPESVSFIGESAFTDYCSATLRVTEGSYAARYAEENGVPFTYDMEYRVFESGDWLYTLMDGLATIYGYDEAGRYSYDDANDLVIPNYIDGYPVIAIKARPFPYSFKSARNLNSVVIREGVASIGDSLFEGCSDLTRVTIPESCTSIGEGAFNDCPDLVLTVIEDSYGWQYAQENGIPYVFEHDLHIFKSGDFRYTLENGHATLVSYNGNDAAPVIPNAPDGYPLVGIGDNAFRGCGSLTGISIPESVTSIGNGAFRDCSDLARVMIPKGVASIGSSAFRDCANLTSIVIPEGVKSIGNSAFRNCVSLTGITIHEGVTAIGEDMFHNCSSLTNIVIPESVITIGENAFYGCSSLSNIATPLNVTTIDSDAFLGCSSLTDIVIPKGVTAIGNYVFAGCRSLSSIMIPETVTTIGSWTFTGCGEITLHVHEGSYAEEYAKDHDVPYVYFDENGVDFTREKSAYE